MLLRQGLHFSGRPQDHFSRILHTNQRRRRRHSADSTKEESDKTLIVGHYPRGAASVHFFEPLHGFLLREQVCSLLQGRPTTIADIHIAEAAQEFPPGILYGSGAYIVCSGPSLTATITSADHGRSLYLPILD